MNITYAPRYRRPRYEAETSGRVGFCYSLEISGATFAEIEGAADFDCKFGEEPSGYGIHFDPGSGDEIDITAWLVDCTRVNPEWVRGEENAGVSYHLTEQHPAPAWLVSLLKADKEFLTKLYQDISETARKTRSRIR